MEKEVPSTEATSSSTETKNSDYGNEFYNTGRIGRRNALPDILGYNQCTTTTADLPDRLSALTTKDENETENNSGNTSYINRDQPSTSQACMNSNQSSTAGTSNNVMNNT